MSETVGESICELKKTSKEPTVIAFIMIWFVFSDTASNYSTNEPPSDVHT